MGQVIDAVDLQILQFLIEDSTRSHKELGQLVHLTGQAVGARIRKLEDSGVIEGYTVRWNPEKIGQTIHAFITVFLLTHTAHQALQLLVKAHDQVVEMHRVSGEGCYWMRVRVGSIMELNTFLDQLLQYANYKVSLSIGQHK
ncbi:Lrp/AsnC family transcriptional regulator [Brevibacterium sp. JNUCC-42]|nr:Lrp/AsnC family transcriptional regulator [Brevibacterium sp. JNUCC-42]